jgi:hypothetical protein
MPGDDLAIERIDERSWQSAVWLPEPYCAVPARKLDVAMEDAGDVVHFIREADGKVGQWWYATAPVLLS